VIIGAVIVPVPTRVIVIHIPPVRSPVRSAPDASEAHRRERATDARAGTIDRN
jgi:hypothetical protein